MASASVLPSAKQATLQLVERLEDDVSFEDIIYELYVLEKIQRGMKDAQEGRVVSHADAKERLSRWLK
jgi:predicted transcriptional regulator